MKAVEKFQKLAEKKHFLSVFLLLLLLEWMQQWGKCRQREQKPTVYLIIKNRHIERIEIEVVKKLWECALKNFLSL